MVMVIGGISCCVPAIGCPVGIPDSNGSPWVIHLLFVWFSYMSRSGLIVKGLGNRKTDHKPYKDTAHT